MSAACAIFNVYKFPICNTNTSGNENVSEFQWFLAEIRAHKFLDRIVPLNHSLLSNTFLYVNRSTPISLNWTQIKPNAIIVSPEINYLNSNNSSSYAKTEQKNCVPKIGAPKWHTIQLSVYVKWFTMRVKIENFWSETFMQNLSIKIYNIYSISMANLNGQHKSSTAERERKKSWETMTLS